MKWSISFYFYLCKQIPEEGKGDQVAGLSHMPKMTFSKRSLQNGKVIVMTTHYSSQQLSSFINFLLAWLRGRRKDVPTIEEVLRSAGISQMKKENAKKVALENPFVKEDDDDNSRTVSKVPFPTYNEYDMPPDPKQKS